MLRRHDAAAIKACFVYRPETASVRHPAWFLAHAAFINQLQRAMYIVCE